MQKQLTIILHSIKLEEYSQQITESNSSLVRNPTSFRRSQIP